MTNTSHPTWRRFGQKTVYKGRSQVVVHDAELPNGEHTTYEVEHSDGKAVAVLIKTPDNKIVLTHQFRFPLDRWIYDLPGGGSPVGEDIEEAAIRECREEVSIRPKSLVKLATFYTNPGRADWPMHLFYCEDFETSELKLDNPSEIVEKVLMPIEELDQLIRDQQIVDPSLLITWHTARNMGYITV
jgi:8-oxo-dGTP pyrophosphatase MutT (NUDIX family)